MLFVRTLLCAHKFFMCDISFSANLICFLKTFQHLFVAFLRTVCVIRKLLVKFACLFPELVSIIQRFFEFSVVFKLYPLLSVLFPEVGDVIHKFALFFRTYNFSLLPKFKLINFALEFASESPPATLNFLLIWSAFARKLFACSLRPSRLSLFSETSLLYSSRLSLDCCALSINARVFVFNSSRLVAN